MANFPLRKIPSLKTYLKEADEDKKTKTATDTNDLSKMFEPQKDQPIAKVDKPSDKPSDKPTADTPKIKSASAADTARAMRGVSATDDMRDMMSKLNVPDELVDREPELDQTDGNEPKPPTADNVPAVISRAIATTDPNAVDPKFHQVKNLPGYMSRAIRAMGRETFKNYTSTPIEDISVIANLGGQGPNSERELNGVSAWLKHNAKEVDKGTLDFGQMMPGYKAQTILFSTQGVRFLVVRDFAGGYIYAWPEGSSSNELEGPKAAKALAAPSEDDDLDSLMKKYGL